MHHLRYGSSAVEQLCRPRLLGLARAVLAGLAVNVFGRATPAHANAPLWPGGALQRFLVCGRNQTVCVVAAKVCGLAATDEEECALEVCSCCYVLETLGSPAMVREEVIAEGATTRKNRCLPIGV